MRVEVPEAGGGVGGGCAYEEVVVAGEAGEVAGVEEVAGDGQAADIPDAVTVAGERVLELGGHRRAGVTHLGLVDDLRGRVLDRLHDELAGVGSELGKRKVVDARLGEGATRGRRQGRGGGLFGGLIDQLVLHDVRDD